MTKRAFIIHGWSGMPEQHWLPWLKVELENRGFQVTTPAMPDTDEPEIEKWVGELAKQVGVPDENTYLIGHSIGCQTILRYLERLRGGMKIGGVIFVAGWFNLPNLETEEEKIIAKPWLEQEINLEKVKKHCDNFTAIFSDDDPDVPLSDKDIFAEKLGAKIVIESNKGHFTADDGVLELPSALVAINSFF